MRSIIRQKDDGYYILKGEGEKRLTNWTISIEAVIIKSEDERIRKVKLKKGKDEVIAHME